MQNEYKNNHYVPQWYQNRFLPENQKNRELFYLDLNPDKFTDPRGVVHLKKAVKKQGFKFCFAEEDLYTAKIGSIVSKEIETYFFGNIDNKGRGALDYFENFAHPSVDGKAFDALMIYMSTQKLRTPKGLGWLREKAEGANKDQTLRLMLKLRQFYTVQSGQNVFGLYQMLQNQIQNLLFQTIQ